MIKITGYALSNALNFCGKVVFYGSLRLPLEGNSCPFAIGLTKGSAEWLNNLNGQEVGNDTFNELIQALDI
jgi:hypothetical protein